MMEVSFNVGLLIGPLVSGGLSEILGYYCMNCVMCMLSTLSRRRFGYRLISVSNNHSAHCHIFLYLSPALTLLKHGCCLIEEP